MKTEKWKMPTWMKAFISYIVNTGGNDIEDMVNSNTDPFINLPRSTLEACVKSQVRLLEALHDDGEID